MHPKAIHSPSRARATVQISHSRPPHFELHLQPASQTSLHLSNSPSQQQQSFGMSRTHIRNPNPVESLANFGRLNSDLVGGEGAVAHTMATTRLLSFSFGMQAGCLRSSCLAKNSGRRGGAVVVCSSGIQSQVRDSLKMAVILPIAACTILAASPLPVNAGILSGASGMESVELPPIPEPDFVKKLLDDKRKMYEGQDETFRNSSYLQELLKKSKDNAAMHKKEIADKYCERGAEWGVGDCSLGGMNQEQRENFMKVLKQK